MTPQTSQKIKILSFIAILLVVLLHGYNLDSAGSNEVLFDKSPLWMLQDFVSFGLTRVAVPMFFAISGFLFFMDGNSQFLGFVGKMKKRVRTLLVPFLFWSLAGLALYFVLQSLPPLQPFFNKGLVRDYSLSEFFTVLLVHPIPYQFWFIRDLIVLVALSPVLYVLIRYSRLAFLTVCLVVWIPDFGPWNNSAEALLFFVAGGYLAMYRQVWLAKSYARWALLLLAIWMLLLAAKTTALYLNQIFLGRMFLKASILVGVLALWGSYDRYFKNGVPKAMVKASVFTFFVYAFHEPMLTIIKKVLFAGLGKGYAAHFAVYLLAPVGAIAVAMLVGPAFKKMLPRFYALVTGGR